MHPILSLVALLALSLATMLLLACQGGPAEYSPQDIAGIGPVAADPPHACATSLCCSRCPIIPVVRVVDGDTFVSAGDQTVRLYGVDAPERDEGCYTQASARLAGLAGERVRVEPGPRQLDRFGRYLLYAYTEDGRSIDELLVREGLGTAWTADGQHRLRLSDLEGQAKGEGPDCSREGG